LLHTALAFVYACCIGVDPEETNACQKDLTLLPELPADTEGTSGFDGRNWFGGLDA
jgi:hypothetical protein